MILIVQKSLQLLVQIFFAVFFAAVGKPTYSKNLKKAIDMYSHESEFEKLFAQIRAWDAPYDKLEKYVPKSGTIIDLGSGDGLLVNFLALSSSKRKLMGMEINKERADRAFRGLKNTSFKHESILKTKYPSAKAYVIAHVLHHLPSRQDQEKVIKTVAKSIEESGVFLVLEIDEKPLLKYIFTWLTDAITVPLLFEKQLFTNKFYYRKEREWKSLLKENGFLVKSVRLHRGTPFSHILFICTK